MSQAELDKLKDHETNALASVIEVLLNALDTPVNHLRGLVREPAVNQAFRSSPSEARAIMGEHLQTLLYRNPLYDRARWLSATGLEVARVDDAPAGPLIAHERELLDHSAHAVYQEAIRLTPGQIYLSGLDLSGEGEEITIPYKPILQLAIRLPVIEGRDQGLLVIAYRAQRLLDRIRTLIPPGPEHQPMLLNPDGFWLLAPNEDDAWGFRLGHDRTLAQDHPVEWAHMREQPVGQILTASGLWSWSRLDPATRHPDILRPTETWTLVTLVSSAELARVQWQHWGPLWLIAISALLLLGVGVYFYRKLLLEKEAAESVTRSKSEFLAHMSHEIRTPMNAVLGLAQLLERAPLGAEQRAMVQRIREAGQSLLMIINEILDFSKIEAGQLRLESRPFNLETLTTRLDSLLGPAARGKGLSLRIIPPSAPLGPLQGDPLRLEQVLINLTGNAIKFTEQGEVSIRLSRLDESAPGVRLRCEVQDSGIGMSPETRANLFQPFNQADSGITRRFGGTGLGLVISKRLVEMMGGQIGVESQLSQGSTFWIELPLARAESAAVDETDPPPSPLPVGPRLTGLHLLAVDDSPMNRDLVERVLTLEWARVTLAADGQQAVQLLRVPNPVYDAVLMDVQMPIMDGLTATRLIRAELGLADLPIIALTAGVLPEEQAAIRAAGADATLTKPLDLELLVATLIERIPRKAWQAAAARADHPASVGRAREAPDGDALPRIAGIDPTRAALATGHDRAFFLAQLRRLLRDSAGVARESREALRVGDRATAARRMHSLKGNAGNLGALELMRAAGALETAITTGASALEADLAALDQRLAALAEASAVWLEPRPDPAQARAPSGPAPVLVASDLAALRQALERHDLAAIDLFEALALALTAAWGESNTQTLGQAIADLEFGAALTALDTLRPPLDRPS